MSATGPVRDVAVTPLSDVDLWARTNLLVVIMLVIGAILVTRFANWVGNRITDQIDRSADQSDALVRTEAMKHRHAVTQVVTWAMLVVIYSLTAVLVVKLLGLPITGFVAPATVAGVALGFGAQRIVADIFSGFLIVTERQYGFGDLVRLTIASTGLPPITGIVEEVTLRVTRIRTNSGEVVITPNGQIIQVTNLSRDWARAVIDVPVPLTADVARVTDALRAVCEEAFADESLSKLMLDAPSVMGVESIEVDQFNVRVVARSLPGKQFEVGRAMRARITTRLAHDGITVAPAMDTEDPAPAT